MGTMRRVSSLSSLLRKTALLQIPTSLKKSCNSMVSLTQLKSQLYEDGKDAVKEKKPEPMEANEGEEWEGKEALDSNAIVKSNKSTDLANSITTATLLKNGVNVKCNSRAYSASKPITVNTVVYLLSNVNGKPWHSRDVLSKLNFQQLRFNSQQSKCNPKRASKLLPLPCVINRKPPELCSIPTQKKWPGTCGSFLCLPCCKKIVKKLTCDRFLKTEENCCPRKTYRIPSFHDCNTKKEEVDCCHSKKECCFNKRICYARKISEREISPLMGIRDRQADVLGKFAKNVCEPWGN